MSDIAHTAGVHRTHLEHRLAVVGSKREELSAALEAFAKGQHPGNVAVGCAGSTVPTVASSVPGRDLNGGPWGGSFSQPCRCSAGKLAGVLMR